MPTSPAPVLLWLRRDLRLIDNPALAAAAANGAPVIPVYIDDEADLGGASRWWRGQSLAALSAEFEKLGARLILRRGDPLDQLAGLIDETRATVLHFNRRFEPAGIKLDAAVVTELGCQGIEVLEHRGNRLHEPWVLKTLKGEPFKVFTPFWRCLAESYRAPAKQPTPKMLRAPRSWPKSLPLADFQVTADWAQGMAAQWQPGEAGALAQMATLKAKLPDYAINRDRPDILGTSRLSPHLAWGEISVHAIWRKLADEGDPAQNGFLRELGWRDFNSHLLYHFPKLSTQSWNPNFADFPFVTDKKALKAWQKGLTGYPIVDAGMRELWQTGWMHNRVRMIVASFLIKDLLIDWRAGERWFWDTLVDADRAQNAGNWQWVAGSGADAAPYFRVFNPTTQSEKFDPAGAYIRTWVPELAALPEKHIHAPAEAPLEVLVAAGVKLGRSYPLPLVDHAAAREKALKLYKSLSAGKVDEEPAPKPPKRQRRLF